MNRKFTRYAAPLGTALMCLSLSSTSPAAAPTATPAADSPATAPSQVEVRQRRGRMEIHKELAPANEELRRLIPRQAILRDPAERQRIAPQAIPVIKKVMSLMEELATAPEQRGADPARLQLAMMHRKLRHETNLLALGDQPSIDEVNRLAKSADPFEARLAQSELILAAFLVAADEGGQLEAVERMEKLLKEASDDRVVDNAAAIMARYDVLSQKVTDRVVAMLSAAPGQLARSSVRDLTEAQSIKKHQGKPVVLAGLTADGKQFSTEHWKGKVILVDFWATWCGPCKAELPRVKAMYQQYHDKGLEVLGVSCDQKGDALMAYLAQNPDMPWPQLFDAEKPGWHPLAKQFGITGIPQMFLIDKNGVLRSVEARAQMEDLIPKLLAE